MDVKKECELVSIAPHMFRYEGWNNPRQSLMGFGFSCGKGWFNLLRELITGLAKIDKEYRIRCIQVKEKFGSLRWYYDLEPSTNKKTIKKEQLTEKWLNRPLYKIWSFFYFTIFRHKVRLPNPYVFGLKGSIDRLIRIAERASYKTCETCGNPGKPNEGGWISVLCEECRENRNKRE